MRNWKGRPNHLANRVWGTHRSSTRFGVLLYDPFGNVLVSTGGAQDHTHRFTGKPMQDTGLYYYGARFYDPTLGRFISSDPAMDGLNWWVYVRNNPLKYVDPTGMYAESSEVDWYRLAEVLLKEYANTIEYSGPHLEESSWEGFLDVVRSLDWETFRDIGIKAGFESLQDLEWVSSRWLDTSLGISGELNLTGAGGNLFLLSFSTELLTLFKSEVAVRIPWTNYDLVLGGRVGTISWFGAEIGWPHGVKISSPTFFGFGGSIAVTQRRQSIQRSGKSDAWQERLTNR